MPKTVVTHLSVDLDAVTGVWLIKRFLPGWEDAKLAFVQAGTTLDNKEPDKPDTVHVDTGLGMFDHHQIRDFKESGTKRVFEHILKKGFVKEKDKEALSRIVEFVTSTDHFQEVFFPDPTSDIYDFSLHQVVTGLRAVISDDQERCEIMFIMLDAILQIFRNKISAEKEIKKGYVFQSTCGKTLALESPNEEAVKLAFKMGYEMVVRKDPLKGFVRIKTLPDEKSDLTGLYEKLKKADSQADWYLHVSKNMLLNGSYKNPHMKPSSLSLQTLIDIIKKM